MTNTYKRVSAALLSVLLLCMFTFGASAASSLNVGIKFWKERSDKESMANTGIDASRDVTLTRQSNGTYTLTLPIQQVSKMGVTGYLSGLTIGDVTYTGTVSGDVAKGTGVLTIKNLPASVLTGSDVNKALTVTCNIQMDLSLLGEINQLQHSVLGTLHHLAGGAAQLALVLGGGHHAHGTQCRPRGHAKQHPGRTGGFMFHSKTPFGEKDPVSGVIISCKLSGIRFFYAEICGILFYDVLMGGCARLKSALLIPHTGKEVPYLIHPVEPKKVLCIHDLSGMGRCSLAVILPVLSVMGVQPVALPTVVLSTHTGGLGTPARLDGCAYGEQALEHYHALGVEFDCIYTGYLGGEDQVALAEKAFALWPAAKKIVDPVMGDNGKAYSTVTPALIDRIRALCGAADLILPNYTEAQILLQRQPQTELLTDEAAQALADELTALAPGAVVTGLPLGKYIGCAGSGKDRFLIKKLHISRSFPGTGDLYGAVLIGSLLQGNALSAAADNAAEFVALSIQNTPAAQDTRYGVWFEPLLPRLCPASSAE